MTSLPLSQPEDGVDYCFRGDDLPPYRPFLTGDIFVDVEVPGFDETQAVMIVGHPCGIRNGVELADRVPVVIVQDYQAVPPSQWPKGFFSKFPLPEIDGIGASPAGELNELAMVASRNLERSKRRAVLSEPGILLLQQRFVHSLTRTVVQIERFHEQEEHVLYEAELEEEWLEQTESSAAELEVRIHAFDDLLSNEDQALRKRLRDRAEWTQVRKIVIAAARDWSP